MKKFVLLLAICLVYVRSQSSKGEDKCNGPPNVYYNFGTDGSVVTNEKFNKNTQQGRPGKSGVQGVKGQKGAIGQKGEAGMTDDTAEELQLVKMQLQEMKNLLFSPPRSCDYLNKTRSPSGSYLISPDPRHILPFNVYCNVTGSSTETIIHHDSEAEIQVSNCDPKRCYKRSIHYTASLQQIEALIQHSSQCRQFIKYRCINSVLGLTSNPSYGTWLSRDGTAKRYWGGATSQRNGYCACGESGSCADSGDKCNCDINDNTERFDEGYLTDKADLPVTGLQFGDAANREKGWHTLGPLICSGRK